MTILLGLIGRNSPGKSALLESFRGGAVEHGESSLRSALIHQASEVILARDIAAVSEAQGMIGLDAIVICVEDAGCDEATWQYIYQTVEATLPECKIYLALTKTDINHPHAMNDGAITALMADMPRLSACYRVSAHTREGVDEMLGGIVASIALEAGFVDHDGYAECDRFSVDGVQTIDQLKAVIWQQFEMSDENQHANIAKLIGNFIDALPDTQGSVEIIAQLFRNIGIGMKKSGSWYDKDDQLSCLRLRQANRWSKPGYRETNDSAYVADKGKAKAMKILAAADQSSSHADYDAIVYAKSDRVDLRGKKRQKWVDDYASIVQERGVSCQVEPK